MSALGGDVLLGESADPAVAAACESAVATTVEATESEACPNPSGESTTDGGVDGVSTEPVPTAPTGTEPEPPVTDEPASESPADTVGDEPSTTPDPGSSGGSDGGSGSGGGDAPPSGGDGAPLLQPAQDGDAFPVDPEASVAAGAATLWLHRPFVDPTPPARRLAPGFAKRLTKIARRHGVDWALVLGTLRAEGRRGRVPATQAQVKAVARALAANDGARRPWAAVLAVFGRTTLADRAVAFARYNRSVGLTGLVRGLEAVQRRLERRVLSDPRIDIYAGGRSDVAAGRIDVRVIVLLRYLRRAHGSVTVSSLASGHRLYARPGVVSAHVYGRAVDLSAVGGVPIDGHQEPGGVTEQAIRSILLLPSELRPQQVISLLGLGGPSFPLADHGDHIHVGF